MIFKEDDLVIYCKDECQKSINGIYFDVDISTNTLYWHGRLVHREDGPAIECNIIKEWYIEGKRHRENGPAIESINESCRWFLDNKEYSKEEYLSIVNLKNKQRVLNDI